MPRSARLERVWFEAGPGGARIELAPASEPYAVAEAVSKMVAAVRNQVRARRTKGPCSCGDCLGCEIQEMRRRHAA